MSSPGAGDEKPNLDQLLASHREPLVRFLEREARSLLRHESAEDMAQGVHLRALKQAKQFDYRGEREFLAWLFVVARQFVADRADYWSALRRNAGDVLRITTSSSRGEGGSGGTGGFGVNPAANLSGPATFAMRREMLDLATRALDCLLPRDREIVMAATRGDSNAEIAAALGIAYDAAEKAKSRALERFRKTFDVLSRRAP